MPNNANDQWVDVPATPKAGAGDDGWMDVPQEPPKPRSRGFLAGLKSSIGLENPQAPRLADVIGENILGPGYDVGRGLVRGAKLATRPSSELPENMQTLPRQAAYRAASALAPAIGVDPESIEERGRNEDRAGILGEVAVPLAASMYRGGREPAARALREEGGTGAIRPGVRDAASVTGAIGGFASDPGYGGLFRGHLAGKYAPKLVDMITPKLKGRTPPTSPPPVPRLTDEIGARAGTATGDEGILHIPEPRGAPTTPNLMNSIPREELPGLAKQGRQGAGEQLRATGKNVLYTPEGGYAAPRSKHTLSEIMEGNTPARRGRPASVYQVGMEGSLADAKAAAKELGVDPKLVEEVDDGVFNMPLTKALQQKMRRSGYFEYKLKNGKVLSGEMP